MHQTRTDLVWFGLVRFGLVLFKNPRQAGFATATGGLKLSGESRGRFEAA
jgi:hypothetical protein